MTIKTGATQYPTGIDTHDVTIDDATGMGIVGVAQILANYAAALNALEGELGTNPSQAEATVAALLAKMTNKTILTAKGDTFAATAASTPARVAVGTNGQVFTADSTQAAGVKWASLSSFSTGAAYTPSWGGVVEGNGTNIGRYSQVGKNVQFNAAFTFGTTSSVTGPITLTLPVAIASSGSYPIGNCILQDTKEATSILFPGIIMATGALYYVFSDLGTFVLRAVTATTPFAFTGEPPDIIYVSGGYEAS